jgi:hypothetical protein
MRIDFHEFASLLKQLRPDAAETQHEVISIAIDALTLTFVHAPDDPDCVLMRTRVLKLADLAHPGEFAKAALSGNFLWHATRGARLSVGSDDAVYLTESRPLDELSDAESIVAAIDDFVATVTDWQIRSRLYA